MSFLDQLGSVFDYQAIIILGIRVLSALLCLSVHELCHGFAAWRLGDPTARAHGRLSLNPLHHLDPLGFLLLVVSGFGWAKPVPVDPRYFRQPKKGMALTALAGPLSNFTMAALAALLLGILYRTGLGVTEAGFWVLGALAVLLWQNLGLGVFNLFPIPPLDGSKVLFSVLPDRIYGFILEHERYVMLLLFALVFFGVLDGPLGFLVTSLAELLCRVFGLPLEALAILLNIIYA